MKKALSDTEKALLAEKGVIRNAVRRSAGAVILRIHRVQQQHRLPVRQDIL